MEENRKMAELPEIGEQELDTVAGGAQRSPLLGLKDYGKQKGPKGNQATHYGICGGCGQYQALNAAHQCEKCAAGGLPENL